MNQGKVQIDVSNKPQRYVAKIRQLQQQSDERGLYSG
jgi:hypothetical protein